MSSEGEVDPYIYEQFIKVKCNKFFQEFHEILKLIFKRRSKICWKWKDFPSLDDSHQRNSFGKDEMNVYNSLERKIEYLKDESKSKNKIIEMLISDKKSEKTTHFSQ